MFCSGAPEQQEGESEEARRLEVPAARYRPTRSESPSSSGSRASERGEKAL